MFVTHQSVLCSLNREESRDQFFEFEELWISRVLDKQKIETEEEEETSRREDQQQCSQFQRSSFLLFLVFRYVYSRVRFAVSCLTLIVENLINQLSSQHDVVQL